MDPADLNLLESLFLRRTKLNILFPYLKLLLTKFTAQHQPEHEHSSNSEHQMQIEILNRTVKNPLLTKFSTSPSYAQAFLNQLIKLFENLFQKRDSFYYDIYTLYTEALNPGSFSKNLQLCDDGRMDQLFGTNLDQNVGFVTHQVGSTTVSIIESNQIVSEGTTGLRTWPAAIHLLEYLSDDSKTKTEKWNRSKWNRILELGAGTGLLGIGLLKARGPDFDVRYDFTDHSQPVLERIEANLIVNELSQVNNNIRTLTLDWNSVPQFDLNYDLILATDVVFDPEVVKILVKALGTIFTLVQKRDSPENRFPDCLICCAERNVDLLDFFCTELQKVGLEARAIDRLEQPSWVKRFKDRLEVLRNEGIDSSAELLDSLAHLDADNVPSTIYRVQFGTTSG